MNKKTICFCLFAIFMFLQMPFTFSQQSESTSWNQFRGSNRSGVSPENALPDILPESGPELLWKKEIGSGFSEITISGDRIYTMLSEETDSISGSEYIAAFDAKTGNAIWRTKVDSLFFDTFGNGPRSTPAIGEDNIYSFSSYGKLTANSKEDGKTIWQVGFISEFGSTLPQWAFSSSPVLVDNTLIIEAGGTDSRAFIGFDKNSGKVLWTKGSGISSYNSPVVAEIDGKTNIIFANQTTLYSFNSIGDTLWTYNMTMNGPMAMPVVFDSNKIFISTVRSAGFSIVEVNNNTVKELINSGTMKNDFSSSLYYDGCIYGFNVAALQCISARTGEKKWTKRGFGKGSLILVDDKLLVLSDKGKLIQVKATPEAYTEQGSFQAIDGKSWTAPSFAEGKLYVRNLTEMACYIFK